MKKRNNNVKNKITSILMILLITAGLGLLLYPTISNLWNKFHASSSISNYVENVDKLSADDQTKLIQKAQEFNEYLSTYNGDYNCDKDFKKRYNSVLDIDGDGIMGYLEIGKINLNLPIYHGTGESVLQVGAGHIPWSNLPIGGKGTHSVISGHTGLPSAKLFTDIDELKKGDTFTITVLEKKMTYKVDMIKVVLPEETEDLLPVPGQDYCSLTTCTPYGINTHRLIVRGHRIKNIDNKIEKPSLVKYYLIFGILGLIMIAGVIILIKKRKKKEDKAIK